jgi:hypothetical protein
MTFKEQILSIALFIIIIGLIISLITGNIAFLLLGVIIDLILLYVYMYDKQVKKEIKEQMNIYNQDIINNEICIKPTINNPFMNPTIVDINNNINKNYRACDIDNRKIKKQIDKLFSSNVYKDVNDLYDRNFSSRQFYTTPSTTIPNDQEGFSKWLYMRRRTCKENNGEQCFNNIM